MLITLKKKQTNVLLTGAPRAPAAPTEPIGPVSPCEKRKRVIKQSPQIILACNHWMRKDESFTLAPLGPEGPGGPIGPVRPWGKK